MTEKDKNDLIEFFIEKFSANENAQCNDEEAAALRALIPDHQAINKGTKAAFLARLIEMREDDDMHVNQPIAK